MNGIGCCSETRKTELGSEWRCSGAAVGSLTLNLLDTRPWLSDTPVPYSLGRTELKVCTACFTQTLVAGPVLIPKPLRPRLTKLSYSQNSVRVQCL